MALNHKNMVLVKFMNFMKFMDLTRIGSHGIV